MPLCSILRIKSVTLPWRARKNSRRAAQDLPGLEEFGSSHGNSICGTASKASQSTSQSHKVSLQKLQVKPDRQVSSWWREGGSVGLGSSGLDWEGRRWLGITLVSLSSELCSCMKRFKQRKMFGNEQTMTVPE